MTVTNFPATDPQVYDIHHQKFSSDGLPEDEQGWIDRAKRVAEILAQNAAQRDIENKSPKAEVALLKSSGLTKVLGPKAYGGGGQDWNVGYRVIREVAKADGSIGMLLGYHILWATTANLVGTDEQKERVQKLIFENNYFVGGKLECISSSYALADESVGAVNPRDNDLHITSDGSDIIFNGFKNFNTGGVISDLTILEGSYEGTEAHIFTIVKTEQPGIEFLHNWDNIGLRLTESGSVKINNVRAPWTDAFGWDPDTKKIIESVLLNPFATLLLPTIQLVFSNFYLGIAQGALEFSAKYTVANTRPWPFGGDVKEKATDEFYILERYGNFAAHLRAAEALADRAGEKIAALYAAAGDKREVTPRQRGEISEWVASVKVVTTDVGLRVTSGVFEVTGARATGKRVGLDRFFRDIRTHTVHDPVAYKNRELGRFALLDEVPTPTWYT